MSAERTPPPKSLARISMAPRPARGAAMLLLVGIGSTATTWAQDNKAVHPIYFQTGSARLDHAAMKTLDSLVYTGALNRSQALHINGHASEPGGGRLNDSLSRKRAQAVANYLLQDAFLMHRNIASVSGEGARQTTQKGDDPQSRRVDIRVGAAAATSSPSPTGTTLAGIDSAKPNSTLTLGDVLFEGGSDNLLPASLPQLKELLRVMLERPTLRIRVEGHICCGIPADTRPHDRGAQAFRKAEQQLSEKRARRVYLYLLENGVEGARLSYEGFGYNRPKIFPEKIEDDRKANRRVEVRIVGK